MSYIVTQRIPGHPTRYLGGDGNMTEAIALAARFHNLVDAALIGIQLDIDPYQVIEVNGDTVVPAPDPDEVAGVFTSDR